ncbi:MAG: hypothetical protein NTW21_30465 [Verrucomicrobia bacterium]|nr:hypothetical protein [Verrucomicrobiota bacterium]
MTTRIVSCLTTMFALAAALLTPALAETASTLTNIITPDTCGAGDLNSQTNAPLAGASTR